MTTLNKTQILLQLCRRIYLPFVVLVFTSVAFMSCESENEFNIPLSDTPVLSSSKEDIVLKEKQSESTAITLSWSRGSNRGTDAAIDYKIQIAATSDFESPYEIEVGRVKYSYDFSTATFNNLLLNQFALAPGTSSSISFRVVSVVADESVDPEFSNVVQIAVTPFEPVSKTLYLIGDATPNGWDADNATALTPSPASPGIFTYSGGLTNGDFKLITTLGSFLPSYNKGADGQSIVYRTDDAQPDDKFTIDEVGSYKVTVDLIELTITIEKLDQPPFTDIYIVGDASPSGWNIDSPEGFTQSASDPFIFTYEGLLTAGSFKILAGTTGDWCGQWYRPLTDGESISSTEVAQNAGCDVDNKWAVTDDEKGYYKITLDTRDVTIKFEKINLYLVGDAGPNGWNINSPDAMTSNNEGIYTYSGPLTAGELKISKFKGDWCNGQWINAASPDQAITNGDYIVTSGCDGPDNKWRVTDSTAGEYDITIDLPNGTITIAPK